MTHNKSYDPEFFQLLFEVEDRHFWFRARNRVIATLFKQLVTNLEPGYHVLEVGCGTGNVLHVLDQACPDGFVVGMDLFSQGLHYARQRSQVALLQGDMYYPPFARSFDLIGLFDVLEHLPDDRLILSDLHGMLADGGHLVLTVPAYSSLWSYFDDASHHCRRYEPEDLRQKLTSVGYTVDRCTPFMLSLFPLVWLGRRLAALSGQRRLRDSSRTQKLAASELRIRPMLNEVLLALLSFEAGWLARRWSLPFGTSLLVVASKYK